MYVEYVRISQVFHLSSVISEPCFSIVQLTVKEMANIVFLYICQMFVSREDKFELYSSSKAVLSGC